MSFQVLPIPYPAPAPPGPATTKDASRPVVLLVDDEPVNRMMAAGVLAERFDVVQVSSGAEALEKIASTWIDIAVVDIRMPGMDGLETTVKVKAMANGRFLPVILMTANNEESALSEGLARGADDFVTKPISRVLLEQKIMTSLRTAAVFGMLDGQNRELANYRARALRDYELVRRVFDRAIQRSPTGLPDLTVRAMALEQFNGDLVVSAFAGPTLTLLIGDFAGHGLGAAVGAIPMSEVFYAMTERNVSLELLARELNATLHRMLPSDLFLAACLVEVDLARGRLLLWNAGLPDVLVLGPDGQVSHRVPSTHAPIGVLSSDRIDSSLVEVPFPLGARLAIFSDGLIEGRSRDGAPFGPERVEQALIGRSTERDWTAELWSARHAFSGDTPIEDDITFVGLTHTPELAAAVAAATWNAPAVTDIVPDTSVSVTLSPDGLRASDPLAMLRKMLAILPFAGFRAIEIQVIVTELFVNAVDHGLLELDSSIKNAVGGFGEYFRRREERLARLSGGAITIRVDLGPLMGASVALITVSDTGRGFAVPDVNRMPGTSSKAGRGLGIVRHMVSAMSILDGGRTVKVIVPLGLAGAV